jgi:hypothetical protein
MKNPSTKKDIPTCRKCKESFQMYSDGLPLFKLSGVRCEVWICRKCKEKHLININNSGRITL